MNFLSKYKAEAAVTLIILMGVLLLALLYPGVSSRKKVHATTDLALEKLETLKEAYSERRDFMLKWLPVLKAMKPETTMDFKVLQADLEGLARFDINTQAEFDAFEAQQTRVNSQYAELVSACDKVAHKIGDGEFLKKALQFEAIDRDMLVKRREYHETAFAQHQMADQIDRTFAIFTKKKVERLPVFRSEVEARKHDQDPKN
jgi:hypothetical protein